ncbi:MAG: DNA adenine methylase [Sphingobacteriales bacterium]
MTTKNNPYSPLRYPGGKACLTTYITEILYTNNIKNGVYYEFYAGGAGAALGLLFNNVVDRIVLNDADIHIYAFWYSVLNDVKTLTDLIIDTPVTMSNWYLQKEIYDNPNNSDLISLGFATFFLNRCNRSGILTKAGPIGGAQQNGNYLLDARYNKEGLIARIIAINKLGSRITLYNRDTIELMKEFSAELRQPQSLLYLDPPYYNKGKSLYLNYYNHDDHVALRDLLSNLRGNNWLVSYDQVEPIAKLYLNFNHCDIDINYSLQSKRKMKEIFIFSDNLTMPQNKQLAIYELR